MDEYRRGTEVDRGPRRPEIHGLYRGVIPVVWGIGVLLLLVAVPFGPEIALAVVAAGHVCFAYLVFADIRALRAQGVEWGRTRWAWTLAVLLLPFAAPAYYYVSGRRIEAANADRGISPNDG